LDCLPRARSHSQCSRLAILEGDPEAALLPARLVWASASLSLGMCTYYAFTGAHSFLLLGEMHLAKAAAV